MFVVLAYLSLVLFGYVTSAISYRILCDDDIQNMIGAGECKGTLNCSTSKPDVTPGQSGEYCDGENYWACVSGVGSCTATWSNDNPRTCGNKVTKEPFHDWQETDEPCIYVPNTVSETNCSG
jgi:hypothetical protein